MLHQGPGNTNDIGKDTPGRNLGAGTGTFNNHGQYPVTVARDNDDIIRINQGPERTLGRFFPEGKLGPALLDHRYIAQRLSLGSGFFAALFKNPVSFFQFREECIDCWCFETGPGENRIDLDLIKLELQASFPGEEQGLPGCIHGIQVIPGIRFGVALFFGLADQCREG